MLKIVSFFIEFEHFFIKEILYFENPINTKSMRKTPPTWKVNHHAMARQKTLNRFRFLLLFIQKK